MHKTGFDTVMQVFEFIEGNSPLLISMPHTGIAIPERIQKCMSQEALDLADTDWHLEKLYAFAHQQLDANLLIANNSRYVIDLNRDPKGQSLYANESNTELCPTSCFDFSPLYRTGEQPTAAEIAQRLTLYWQPYHQQLAQALHRIKKQFGFAILYDAHSIKSKVPRFFEGVLPDLSIGTNNGCSCSDDMLQAVLESVAENPGFSHVVDARFKGGYITRHYSDPANHIYGIQMEIAQKTYMAEAKPFSFTEAKAAPLQSLLYKILSSLLHWGANHAAR